MFKNKSFIRTWAILLILCFSNIGLSGCAAGNFSLTRSVGRWNRKFTEIPRVLIYIAFVIIPVYPIAMLVDLVVTNTIDFWQGGSASAMNNTIYKDGYKIKIAHSADPLRKSIMQSYDKNEKLVSTVELRETEQHTIEVYLDGVKKSEVNSIEDGMVQISAFTDTQKKDKILDVRKLGDFAGSSREQVQVNFHKLSTLFNQDKALVSR